MSTPPPYGPLRLTFGRWHNKRVLLKVSHDGDPREKWLKVLAHRGHYPDLFAYGTDTPSIWNRSDLQRCTIHYPGAGTGGLDVDRSDEYLATCPLAEFIRPEHAVSHRGEQHWHAVVDMRGVPPGQWPVMGPIPGGDLKTCGFLPVPGSRHYSDDLYEPVIGPGGTVTIVTCTPQILAAMHASRALGGPGSGGGGNGGGHDGEVAAQVLGWVRQAVNAGRDPADPAVKEEIYARWLEIAIPRDPDWPFERGEDFEDRHYRTAVATVLATPSPVLSPDTWAWAQRVTEQARAQGRPRRRVRRSGERRS